MSLLTPYYEHDGIVIYHGDCRDILPHLPKVDLVLTDPPYGIGERMQGGTWGAAKKYADFRRWDIAPTTEVFTMLKEQSKYQIVWGGNYFGLDPSRCWLVWDKQNAVKTMADCELAWTNLDRPAKRFSWPVGIHEWGHPTEKPLELMQWCIALIKPDATILDPTPAYILDPFMGTGTTLRAAKDLGRKCIGIEIEEKYCEIAARRLGQEVLAL